MNEILQPPLFDYEHIFPDFKTERQFWTQAAEVVCGEINDVGDDDFRPDFIKECIEGRYPVKHPEDVNKYNTLMEDIAEVCEVYDGAHGYRGLWKEGFPDWDSALHKAKRTGVVDNVPFGGMFDESDEDRLIETAAEILGIATPPKDSDKYRQLRLAVEEMHRKEVDDLEDIRWHPWTRDEGQEDE
ncbi:hypothetical protein EOL73_03485 [Candidatus Saccharibacteria bacterium]|nr:hypothetical protein [Candidatus Saccharibacteria bacterium]